MRATSFIIVLAVAAICFPVPFRAEAYQSEPFVKFLVGEVCKGQTYAFRNGCNAYLNKRITQHKPPDTCLSECNNQCDSWFSTDPVKKAQCKEGCQYLNSKE